MIGGVYEIRNTVNGKRYIGSAVDFRQRWAQHQSRLKHGVHHSPHLQAAWMKYQPAAFTFRPVMFCEREDLITWEQRYIDEFSPEYNICPVAGSTLGVKASAETRLKQSQFQKGRAKSDEHRRKIGDAHRGTTRKPLSAEHRAKIAARARGRVPSLETRAKLAAAHIGRIYPTPSAETRAKISAAGVGRFVSAETRAKTSAYMMGNTRWLGRKHTLATRLKISAGNKGRKKKSGWHHTEEAKARISAALLGKRKSAV